MRKKLTSLSILLLVLSVLSVLNVNTPRVSAVGSPVIRVGLSPLGVPADINGTIMGIGYVFNVSIYTNYTGIDVWGYEFSLTYNPLVLEIVSPNVTNGDLIADIDPYFDEFLAGNVDNTEGELSLTSARLEGQNVTSGPGNLAIVTFNATSIGDSCLTLGPETRLIGIDAGEEYNIIDNTMAGQIENGYFFNTGGLPTHDLEVTSITHNASGGALAGEFVEINATVLNNGTVPERFDVDLYYADWLISIGTETRILNNGVSEDVTFIWNTTDVPTGNYTLTATAGPVCRETDTTDNTATHDKIMVVSPIISIIPDSLYDATLTEGNTFEVTIYTDYDATLIGRSDVWGYEFTLTFNGAVLEVLDVTNGGLLAKTDTWLGNGTQTVFTATETPIITDSEEVYVNQTLMTKPDNYTINYNTGDITLTTAPELGILVQATYTNNATLMDGTNFTAGTPGAGTLSLTSNNVSTTVTGPGILATVTFNVTGTGDADITLGPGTKLIGKGSFYDITLPHRLEHGFFTNGIDMKATTLEPVATQAYPTWGVPLAIDVWVLNNRPMSAGDYNVTVSYVNATGSYLIGNQSLPGLDAWEERSFEFLWDVSGVEWGVYNLTVKIDTDLYDVNPANNELVYSAVTIKIPGDIQGDTAGSPGDGDVDRYDYGAFALAYGYKLGDAKYNVEADFTHTPADSTNKVDRYDFGIFALNYGKTTNKYP